MKRESGSKSAAAPATVSGKDFGEVPLFRSEWEGAEDRPPARRPA